MSFTESNESRPLSAYARGAAWNSKGMFWMVFAVGGMIPVSVVCPILQSAVADHFWSAVIIVVQLVFLAAQLAAGIRMGICYRRAVKIWRAS